MRSYWIAGVLAGLLASLGSAGAETLPLPETRNLPPVWHPRSAGSWQRSAEQPQVVGDGGSDAASAAVITAQIFRDAGNTLGKGNDALLPACTNSGSDTAEDAWYTLTLPGGGSLTAWTTCTRTGIATYDTRLGVFDAGLNLIACNDDDPTCGVQSRIANLTLSAGTYYVVVDGWNGASGPYELNVEWQGPGPPCSGSDAGTATVIPSLPYSDTRDLSSDCDDYLVICEAGGNEGGPDHWYQVTVDVPVLMDVTVPCNPSGLDTRIAILDPEQNELYCNDDASSCASGQSAVEGALLSEGTYYLVVDSAPLTGGTYTVQVDTTHAPSGAIVDLRPDLVTRQNELFDHDIVTNIVPGRTHLRLSNATANVGLGRIYLYGVLPDNGDGTQDIRQRIWQNDGTYFDRDGGTFEYHPEHSHIHVEDWAVYRLRLVTAGEGVGDIVVEGEKTSFCVMDLLVHDSSLPGFSPNALFTTCGSTVQGLSVGWADIYTKDLPGQNLDITDVPDGEYWLESEADPLDHVLETDEANNIARIKITIGNPTTINPDAYEPNDQPSDLDSRVVGGANSPVLGPCAPTKTITGTIHESGNDDYFRFYLPATGGNGDEVRIDFTHANGNLDLELWDAVGTVVETSTGTHNFEKISLKNLPAGWYDARIYGAGGATSPFYALTIDPSQNSAPTITVTDPPAGDTPVLETTAYTTTWSSSDPEGNETWVDVFVNTVPQLDGNEIFLLSSQNTPGAQGFYLVNPAALPHDSYFVYARITDGGTVTGDWSEGTFTIVDVTGVDDVPVAGAWRLLPSIPNPFNPITILRLSVPRDSRVSWRIFDARGALVRTLATGRIAAGLHRRVWDGRDDRGRAVASGTYYVIAESDGYTGRQKVTLLK